MNFKLVLAAAASGLSMVSAGATQADATDIVYTFNADNDLSAFRGALQFRGDADGSTRIDLPGMWGPETGLDGQFSEFSTVEDGASARPVEAHDGHLEINHAPGADLVLHYRFAQDYDGLPQWGAQRVPGMRPVTQPDFAIFVAAAALPHPAAGDGQLRTYSLSVHLDGVPLPVSSSLGQGSLIETGPLTSDAFLDTLWLLGDFQRSTHQSGDVQVQAAMRGALPLDQAAFQLLADRTISGATVLFRDVPFERYLMAAMPLPPIPEQSAVIGTALHESFFLLTTPNAGEAEVRRTVSHEILHEWITGRMGPTDEATDPARMWFTEGFTEYFANLVRLREGDMDLDGFLAEMNLLASEYRASPVRNMPREALVEHVWDSRDTERLPYQRGALLALITDSALADAGDTRLADVVAHLIEENRVHQSQGGTPLALTDDRISLALQSIAGASTLALIDDVTASGQTLDLAQAPLFGCITAQDAGEPAFRLADGADADACALSPGAHDMRGRRTRDASATVRPLSFSLIAEGLSRRDDRSVNAHSAQAHARADAQSSMSWREGRRFMARVPRLVTQCP